MPTIFLKIDSLMKSDQRFVIVRKSAISRPINIPPKRLFSLPELTNLVELDLSFNFFDSIPIEAFKGLENLKFLNLGSNKIKVGKEGAAFGTAEFQAFQSISLSSLPFQTIKEVDLLTLSSLEYIDLSRNHIGEVMPGTFLGMNNLKGLDFSVNTVLKVSSPLLVRPFSFVMWVQ